MQPVLPQPALFLFGRDGPGGDFHVVRLLRKEGPKRERHHIHNHQVGEDQQVAAVLGDAGGARLPVFGDQALVDRVDVGPALFTPGRHPVGHGAAPGCGVLHHGMPIAKVFGKTDHVVLRQHTVHVLQVVKVSGMG